jgi:hypothetical protein
MGVSRGAKCRAIQCRFFENGWWGAIVYDKGQGIFEECEVTRNGDAGLGVDGESSSLRVLQHCKVFANGWGLGAYDRGTLEVQDCTIETNNNNGLNVMAQSKVTLTSTKITRNRMVGIYARTKARVRVEKCDLTGNGRGPFLTETEATIEAKDNQE